MSPRPKHESPDRELADPRSVGPGGLPAATAVVARRLAMGGDTSSSGIVLTSLRDVIRMSYLKVGYRHGQQRKRPASPEQEPSSEASHPTKGDR